MHATTWTLSANQIGGERNDANGVTPSVPTQNTIGDAMQSAERTTMSASKNVFGWYVPLGAHVAHYFNGGVQSLCHAHLSTHVVTKDAYCGDRRCAHCEKRVHAIEKNGETLDKYHAV